MQASALGFAGGILWGVSLAFITIVSVYTGYASLFLHMISDLYPGFDVSLSGALIGLSYGFLDGFIGFYLIGWLYNRFASQGA